MAHESSRTWVLAIRPREAPTLWRLENRQSYAHPSGKNNTERARFMVGTDLKIAVIGLGYVGLPLAMEFGKKYDVIGYDVDVSRISDLNDGNDRTLEMMPNDFRECPFLTFTSDKQCLHDRNCFIVTVPTPIDDVNRPDLTPLIKASETVAEALKINDTVI